MLKLLIGRIGSDYDVVRDDCVQVGAHSYAGGREGEPWGGHQDYQRYYHQEGKKDARIDIGYQLVEWNMKVFQRNPIQNHFVNTLLKVWVFGHHSDALQQNCQILLFSIF
jgi:hypothetical protein